MADDPSKPDPRERLAELLGPGSRNFLGTGLTMKELVQLVDAEKFAASWYLQRRPERQRRLRAVIRLSAELDRVRQSTEFSTRLAEISIEGVIEGDWKLVETYASYFTFSEESRELPT